MRATFYLLYVAILLNKYKIITGEWIPRWAYSYGTTCAHTDL